MTAWGIASGLLSVFGVILGGYLAYKGQAFWPSQMALRGLRPGDSFASHGGMISDIILISFIVTITVSLFGDMWSLREILIAAAFAVISSSAMHDLYLKVNVPSAHVLNGALTPAGWVHWGYMTFTFVPIFLFYFGTPKELIPYWLAWLMFGIIAVHITLGTHIPLKLIKPSWCTPIQSSDIATCLGVYALLGWRTYVITAA